MESISEMGWIGLGFTSTQAALSCTTQVFAGPPSAIIFQDTSLSDNPSFALDIPSAQISINLTGIYRFHYNLELSCQSLTLGGAPVQYQSYIQYFDGIQNQQVGYDQVYGPDLIASTPRGITLKSSFIVNLTAGQNIQLFVSHDSDVPEGIVGHVTGSLVGSPRTYHSYLQIQRIG